MIPARKTGRPSGKLLRRVAALLLLVLLSGCAAQQAYREGRLLIAEGQGEKGLDKLQEAQRLDPGNIEYRIAYLGSRTSVINQLLAEADVLQRGGKLTEAEKTYRRAQALDPENIMARQGMDNLVTRRQHRQLITEAEALHQKDPAANAEKVREKLRVVLAEDPRNRDALNLKERVDSAQAATTGAEGKLAGTYDKPVTLEFRDAPVKTVFDAISKVSGLNFFLDKDIRPDLKTTILARNVAIKDAVRLVLITSQLEQRILSENSVLIYPNTPQKLKDYQTLGIRTFYLANADVKAVSNTIKSLVKTQDLVIDERLGLLMMRDTPEAIRVAEKLISLQDLADPEVMLEVEVLEVKRSRLLELGVRWPDQLTLSPVTGSSGTLTLDQIRNLDSSTLQANIGTASVNIRKEDQDANILANPRIRVRNKDKAQVLIGDRVPVITTTSTSTGFVSESVSYVDVGLKVEVEPNVYLDEEVAIKINLEVSNLVREVLSKSGTLTYQIGTRNASTTLRLKDGETQVLAGLISNEERASGNKIPALGDLPLLGRLFGSRRNDAQRSEIVLSIRPHIVRAIRRPDLVAAEFDSGTQTSVGAAALSFTPVPPAEPNAAGGKAPDARAGTVPDAAAPTPAASINGDVTAVPAPAEPEIKAEKIDAKAPSFTWDLPSQVRAGEQFTAVLRVASQSPLTGMPLLVGFDPQVLQVASVQEGEFLRQGGAQTSFNHRVDTAQGKVFVAAVRQSATGPDSGVNGNGNLILINFMALKTASATDINLLSATPEPRVGAVAVPVRRTISVVK
jgi:general secretion pathway protein D